MGSILDIVKSINKEFKNDNLYKGGAGLRVIR